MKKIHFIFSKNLAQETHTDTRNVLGSCLKEVYLRIFFGTTFRLHLKSLNGLVTCKMSCDVSLHSLGLRLRIFI